MNTDQLQCVINKNLCFSILVKGVFSVDTLPRRVTLYPSAYICNTDTSHLPGSHWVVMWFKSSDYAEFFDSFGNAASYYDYRLEDFLKRNVRVYYHNIITVQSYDSINCGYFVLYYLLMKCKDVNISSIVNVLQNVDFSDKYVVKYVSKYFNCLK